MQLNQDLSDSSHHREVSAVREPAIHTAAPVLLGQERRQAVHVPHVIG